MNKAETQTELLAPAKNADFGIAAINHGADAVYIGAPRFSARSAASNTIEDIERLAKYAHLFNAKVYAALNTILYDNELEDASKIIAGLHNIGIDGLIIQDLGLLELNLPPIPLIASTQTNNTTVEKVQFFEKLGFKRVILARELSLNQIAEIHKATTIELESFVHGAICVSYSGQCYMSEAVCNRSANRGACAQPCRSTYDLLDGDGQAILRNKHLLSQKDLNLSAFLPQLLEAGVSSFKIEGRLKDITYVKNIVSYYRQKLDNSIENNPEFTRASSGKTYHLFTPDPERSFNRGFTSYFIQGRKEKTGEPNTQKSIGKRFGYVTGKGINWITTDSEGLANGDGICFFDKSNVLKGTLINKVVGDKSFVNNTEGLEIGAEVYRNHDHVFEKMLTGNCAERKIPITLTFCELSNGFSLTATDENANTVNSEVVLDKELAKNASQARNTIETQLSRMGDTIFELGKLNIQTSSDYYLPISVLNELRRKTTALLTQKLSDSYKPERFVRKSENPVLQKQQLGFSENIANKKSEAFYKSLGAESIEPAFELLSNRDNKVVMTTKYCIKYQFDACPVFQKNKKNLKEPLFLHDQNRQYSLVFDCKKCEMNVIFEK